MASVPAGTRARALRQTACLSSGMRMEERIVTISGARRRLAAEHYAPACWSTPSVGLALIGLIGALGGQTHSGACRVVTRANGRAALGEANSRFLDG